LFTTSNATTLANEVGKVGMSDDSGINSIFKVVANICDAVCPTNNFTLRRLWGWS
jgi:hypothetical protein